MSCVQDWPEPFICTYIYKFYVPIVYWQESPLFSHGVYLSTVLANPMCVVWLMSEVATLVHLRQQNVLQTQSRQKHVSLLKMPYRMCYGWVQSEKRWVQYIGGCNILVGAIYWWVLSIGGCYLQVGAIYRWVQSEKRWVQSIDGCNLQVGAV